eukprot:6847909-Pyramimonas_sp.AAC.1
MAPAFIRRSKAPTFGSRTQTTFSAQSSRSVTTLSSVPLNSQARQHDGLWRMGAMSSLPGRRTCGKRRQEHYIAGQRIPRRPAWRK